MAKILPIVKDPHKVLRKQAQEVPPETITDPKIRELVLNMKETLKNTPTGVGFAAPQVGQSLRIFIVSEEAEEIDRAERRTRKKRSEWRGKPEEKPYEAREWKYYVFINPAAKNAARKKTEDAEGCLSVPRKYGTIKRHEKITVEAYDESGKRFIRGASRFFARVIQHELDHLNGILIIDKMEQVISDE